MRNKSSFFLTIGLIGILAILIGFAKPFILPVSSGNFKAPLIIYVHGAFAFSWVLLFTTQSALIKLKNYKMHKTLGLVGFLIALGVAITIIPVGLYAVEKELKQGLGDTAISGIIGNCTSSIMFIALVSAGIFYKKRPQLHKRLLLLSTIVLLWPAWFRFRHYFPSVERPDIWFAVVLADSLIIISWIWDKMKNGKIHPILFYLGLAIIIEHSLEVIMFDNYLWRITAKNIYEFLV